MSNSGSAANGTKVVRVIARLNIGGPARHVAWLTAGLRLAGFASELVTGAVSPGEEDMSAFAVAQGVQPLVIPQMSREIAFNDLVTIWKLYRLFVRLRPAIVHTHTAKAGTVGRLAGLLYRWLTPGTLVGRPRPCRCVHTYHGHIFHSYYGPVKTRLFLGIEKLLARLATDRIIVLSPQQYREIHEHFGIGRAGQFRVIPLGLDLSLYAGWQQRRPAARQGLGAADGDILVGIVGRLTEVKNHQLFLQAAAAYKARADRAPGRRVRFLIIGDGHLRPALEAQARALALEEDVAFLGFRDDSPDFYAALDVVALTSLNEGTPLTLLEAMANGRAVLATAVGGVVDLVGPATAEDTGGYTVRERGLVVRSQDAAALCQGLARLIADDGLRRELGARGATFIQAHCSKERLLADVAALYGKLLAPHEPCEQTAHGVSRVLATTDGNGE